MWLKLDIENAEKVPVMIDPSVSLAYVAVADFHSSSLEVAMAMEACSRMK